MYMSNSRENRQAVNPTFVASNSPLRLLQIAPSTYTNHPVMAPSTTPSTAPSEFEAPATFNPSDTNKEAAVDASSSGDYDGYEDMDWSRLLGYCVRKHRRRQRTEWVWEYGFDIEKDSSGRRFWLRKECHHDATKVPFS